MYAKVEEAAVVKVGQRPNWYKAFEEGDVFPDDPVPLTDEELRAEGWYPVVGEEPTYDPLTEASELNPIEQWTVGATEVIRTFTVRPLTEAELADRASQQRQQAQRQAESRMAQDLARERAATIVRDDTTPFETVTELAPIFDDWEVGLDVDVGDLLYYNGTVVEVLQAHTTQADWQPPDVPALFKVWTDPSVASPWSQPAGAHDAYALGAEVTHNGRLWVSEVPDNVWEPGVFGWGDIGAAP